ncbi:MAG: HAMP domain-containing sensor histidine kinase [Lachnospiraceae bacterium]|nr:HAMP domain-containing sensor histidine kinase [Lachnospiraceae bacterium]
MHIKSILKKQLLLYMSIFVFSFAVLIGVLYKVYSDYYISQKEDEFIKHGKKISEEFANYIYVGVIDTSAINLRLDILENYMNASVFFLDSEGRVLVASPGISQEWIGKRLSDDAKKDVLDGNIISIIGKAGGMFSEPMLMVGYPIKAYDNTIGSIFMCSALNDIQKAAKGMWQAGVVCIIIILIFGAILVYISGKRITKPLLEMNEAAKVIANGNFDKRLEVKSNDEIGELAKSFNYMAESLDEYDKVRKSFIANVSHDLRSPLTSIQGFLNAIIDGTVPPEKTGYYLNIVLEETVRLSKLTNDVVDLTRAQSDIMPLEITDFDINQLIKDVIATLEPRFTQKDIFAEAIFETENIFVSADIDKIQRVIYNLLDNALKFTDENGKIQIETQTIGEKAKIYVRDSGKGINEGKLKYVFDRFYKTDDSRGEYKTGSGLGLSIVKEFIRLHNENIEVKSEEGLGTEFVFTLELSKHNE